MSNTNLKITFSTYLRLTFFLLIFVLILTKDFVFEQIIVFTGSNEIEESQRATAEITNLLLAVDKISFDTKILSSSYLQSLTSMPIFPIDSESLINFGKANPFIGNFILVNPSTTTAVGGVVYSNQRSLNSGQSIRTVPSQNR